MAEFTMPSLGADMEQGTMLEWLVKPGDTVKRGDVVAVVDTSKAAVEVETFVGGVVGELLVEPGSTVAVGTPLAVIDGSTSRPAARPEAPSAPPVATEPPVPPGARSPRPVRTTVPATPLARRLAEELGVDIDRLGTPGGLPVRAEDVRAAAGHAPAEVAAPEPVVEPAATGPATAAPRRDRSEMRATIAARMSRANREIPHYYLTTTVDLAHATEWLRDHNLAVPVAERIVPAALFIKATALAAAAVPELNGFWIEDRFEPGAGVHVGMAVSLRGGGLIAPALHDADRMPVAELMRVMRAMVTRARAGRLRSSELSDPTITITNLGEQGVDAVYGVIYPPQVALVGFGRVAERPFAVDGLLGIRPTTTLTLAADHRATDGFTGGRFLALIDHLLQHPEEL